MSEAGPMKILELNPPWPPFCPGPACGVVVVVVGRIQILEINCESDNVDLQRNIHGAEWKCLCASLKLSFWPGKLRGVAGGVAHSLVMPESHTCCFKHRGLRALLSLLVSTWCSSGISTDCQEREITFPGENPPSDSAFHKHHPQISRDFPHQNWQF